MIRLTPDATNNVSCTHRPQRRIIGIVRPSPLVYRGSLVKHFKAIAAMSLNRVIGQGLKIPWHLPEDFKWFKQMTTGQIVVMGRKTFESIGRPLPNRATVVLTRSGASIPGVETISDLNRLHPGQEARDIFICGGAQVYAEALPLCSDLYLTLVKRVVAGDVFFPSFEDRFAAVETLRDGDDFSIIHYRNRLF